MPQYNELLLRIARQCVFVASMYTLVAKMVCRAASGKINNRIDDSFCFEKHFIRGQAKMKTRMKLALVVMIAMALGQVKAGRLEQMCSLYTRFDKRVKFIVRRFPTQADCSGQGLSPKNWLR